MFGQGQWNTSQQEVVSNCDHLAQLKFSRTLPFPSTKYGAIQAANVLNSSHAVEMSVYIVRTFIRLREMIVKRNQDRFPEDFMFQLTDQEFKSLRSQSVTSSWGGRRYAPYAFTEQGVAMLSSVLKSPQAIALNIEIMRAFVRLREMLASNKGVGE